jgi:small subunit ribosomal protein S6
MLARTEITNDELSTVEDQFEKLASTAKGSVISFDRWGKYRLSYPVKKNDYGVYILARYELDPQAVLDTLKELDLFFKIKCNDIIMRYATIKLDPDVPLSYQKPEPIDGGASNLDTFIKEHKMEGILGTDVEETSKSEPRVKTESSSQEPEQTVRRAEEAESHGEQEAQPEETES